MENLNERINQLNQRLENQDENCLKEATEQFNEIVKQINEESKATLAKLQDKMTLASSLIESKLDYFVKQSLGGSMKGSDVSSAWKSAKRGHFGDVFRAPENKQNKFQQIKEGLANLLTPLISSVAASLKVLEENKVNTQEELTEIQQALDSISYNNWHGDTIKIVDGFKETLHNALGVTAAPGAAGPA